MCTLRSARQNRGCPDALSHSRIRAFLSHRPYRGVVSLSLGNGSQGLSAARQLCLLWILELALRSAADPHLGLERFGCATHTAVCFSNSSKGVAGPGRKSLRSEEHT